MHLISSAGAGLKRRAWLMGLAGLAAVVAVAALYVPASAYPPATTPTLRDLNTTIRNQAPKILAELQKRGYQNVGVLKFQAKVDQHSNTMHSGRLNQQMATRIENALILVTDPDSPTVGITRDAGAAAMKADKKATWLDAQGRVRLFNHSYPMAWGKTSKKVDAFLTGLVAIDSKGNVVHVVIHVFDRKNPTPQKLAAFQAKLTSNVLAETGQRFVVKKRTIKDGFGGTVIEEDPFIPDNSGGLTSADQSFNSILDFRITYDGFPVNPVPDITGAFKCNPPAPGQKVVFRVRSPERIGLVLFVNGVNTLKMARADEVDVSQHYRWILDPNQEYTIEGFYPDFQAVRKFQAMPEGETNPGELGPEDRWGLIELHVFKDAGGGNGGSGNSGGGNTGPIDGGPIGTDTIPPDLQQNNPPELELRSLRKKLSKINKTPARNLITGGVVEGANVQEVTFNGTLYVSRTIMYHQKGGGAFDLGLE